ncbi:PAS domain-containing protein [Sphingomonas sp. PB2P19]|uniref:PAS domain-containing protein n=1 Tax=Sphingomonas rhamnosi TaxID=3096156 RepID=UPI002FC82DED
MAQSGHVFISSGGQLLDVDAAFCDIMRCDADDLRGRLVLEVTAPADRTECARAIATLRQTRRPFVIVKRFVRHDGSHVWVRNSVSMSMDGNGAPMMEAIIEPVDAPADNDNTPAALLDVARFLVTGRRDRGTVGDRALFADLGWDAVLAAYVAEAEGRAVDVVTLARMLDHPAATVGRWVKALLQHGMLEIECRSTSTGALEAYRLTGETHRKLEAYLGRIRPQRDLLTLSA